jgi:iron transport multicopper oxidase
MTVVKMKIPCKSLLFFGDGSQETQTALSQILLSQKQDSLLGSFLTRARSALQDEYMKLSQSDRDGIPDFQDLYCLLRRPGDEKPPHPALHPVEIALVQLAYFIA